MAPRVLIVEPDAGQRLLLTRAVRDLALVEHCTDFYGARNRLTAQSPDFLVSNLRLRSVSGLHLLYLAAFRMRTIVYVDGADRALLLEAQRLGAFVESASRLPLSLPSYLRAPLPARDRRDPRRLDESLPGGRRAGDV
jgi:DNA-binding NtrC family response regulator